MGIANTPNHDPEMQDKSVARPPRPCYFLIQYGLTQRWSSKHKDVRDAAHETFGLSTSSMKAWNLGYNLVGARKVAKGIKHVT